MYPLPIDMPPPPAYSDSFAQTSSVYEDHPSKELGQDVLSTPGHGVDDGDGDGVDGGDDNDNNDDDDADDADDADSKSYSQAMLCLGSTNSTISR